MSAGLDDGLEVALPGLQRHLVDLAVRQSAAARVVPGQFMSAGDVIHPVPCRSQLRVGLQIAEPSSRP